MAQARPVTLGRTLERPGTLVYRRLLRVYNREAGFIQRIPFFEGDRVHRGELLLRLDSRLLEAQVRKAEATLRLKRRRLERLEKLLDRHAASTDEVNEARTERELARAELDALRIRLTFHEVRAPFDGIVTQRLAEPGDARPAFSHLLTVADPNSRVVRFTLPGELASRLAPGRPVTLLLDHRPHPGHLLRRFPTADPATRLVTLEAAFEQLPTGALAGRQVRVRITTPPRPRLLIPLAALQRDRRGEHVFVVEDGHARRRAVTSGLQFGDRIEILDGLEAGDEVVVRGLLGLTADRLVRVVQRTTGD